MKLKKSDYTWCCKLMKKWQEKLNMKDYCFILKLEQLHENKNAGVVDYNVVDKTSVITLNVAREWKDRQQIEVTIFHEVCECMLCDITTELEGLGMAEWRSQQLAHNVIRRLENLIFE